MTLLWLTGCWTDEHGRGDGFYIDVDSGPVLAGFGTSATAFGLGAARSLGDQREARAVALQAIAASVPLPNGRLLLPRLLSDASDAPLLGEAALLYNLSQPPAPGFAGPSEAPQWREVPGLVWLVLLVQWVLGSLVMLRAGVRLRQSLALRRASSMAST